MSQTVEEQAAVDFVLPRFGDGQALASARENESVELQTLQQDGACVVPIASSVPYQEYKVYHYLLCFIFGLALLVGLLFMFNCSLDFFTSACRLLGGRAAGKLFINTEVLLNPVAGLMVGVLSTVLVQSASTSTSIVVSMVGAELINVQAAIPIIMGANIGTSVTNTIVSLGLCFNKNEFHRAFGGATLHHMFNWLSVLILLPLEVNSGYLYHLSGAIVESFHIQTYEDGDVKLLKALTSNFTQYIIKVDTKIITLIALNQTDPDTSLIRVTCKHDDGSKYPCKFMFMKVAGIWEDWVIGLILLFIALFVLYASLILMVKILNNIFKVHIAAGLKMLINADFPCGCGTGYLAMIIGASLTLLTQSSAVFLSALVPLSGAGVITLERMYPLTLGANIGTMFTAILASLTQEGVALKAAMQVCLCHLFFNISGMILWYSIPYMKEVPIYLAVKLGSITAKYGWFAFLYIVVIFYLLPLAVYRLCVAGWQALVAVVVPVLFLIIVIIVINIMQSTCPPKLPKFLRKWKFIP